MKPPLKWIIARFGDDGNWWVDETSENTYWGGDSPGLLDPRQVAWLRDSLERYTKHGLDPAQLERSFSLYEVASELSDGRLKLVPSENSFDDEGVSLFALPDIQPEGEGGYPDFLDQLAVAHVRYLNETHDYYEDVSEDDMEEDIRSRNNDRYFAASALHVFNELEDVLTWKPAEWDDEPVLPDRRETEDRDDEAHD